MKINWEPIKSWFGFSRRERRSTFILLIIICLIIMLKYVVPEKNIAVEYNQVVFPEIEKSPAIIKEDKTNISNPFTFDPNTAPYDTLLKLGLASKAAGTLIKYRNKGGKFRTPSDIKKVYGIDDSMAKKLMPYVEVKTITPPKQAEYTYNQPKEHLEVNSCDSASFVSLPGIGPVLAARIIKYRRLLGGFASVDQLKDVYGLPVETYDLIKGWLYADTLIISRININSADFKTLARLPYIEKFEVTAILKYRELKGRISEMNELTGNKLIGAEKAVKVRPYLRFE
jgi:competence protein ComEA